MDQMVSDRDYCVDRRSGIFDHRLGEICFASGHANRCADCVPASCSTFKSSGGTIPDSHRRAYTKGNTHRYREPYAVTKFSPFASASPASTPSPIASLTFTCLAGSVLVPATEKQRNGQRDRDARVQSGFQRLISLLTLARRLSLWLVL